MGEGSGGEGRGWSKGKRVETLERRRTSVPLSAGEGAVGETGPPVGDWAGMIWRVS